MCSCDSYFSYLCVRESGRLYYYSTVSVALRVLLPYVPEIVSEAPLTGLVVTENVMPLEPAGMVVEEGTRATLVLLLFSETTAPDGGAAPLSVKVPVEDAPPVTVLGFKVREVREGGFTVKVVVFVVPSTALSVTEVCTDTRLVVIVNVVLVDPAGMVTVGDT